jgi:hypothetical protein
MTAFGAALRATSVGYAAGAFDVIQQLAEPKASLVETMKNRGQRSLQRHYRRGIRGRLGVVFGATVVIPTMALGSPDTSHVERITVGTTAVSVEFPETQFGAGTEPLLVWIRRSMNIVSAYYGRFPSRTLRIKLVAEEGGGVYTGTTWGREGGLIRLKVGRDVTDTQMLNDWVLVHEMTHLALPDVGEEHAWLSEGLAVYIEGIERVQAGNRSEEDVFAEELHSMPRGLPEAGDQGLDHTHTWGRTYWGGAMFCLLADVAIHLQTDNRFGLQDAMRAVLKSSGGLSSHWSIERTFQTADLATGTHVLEQLYVQMKDQPVTPDLPGLWAQLGVHGDGSTVSLADDAPLAYVRRAIMGPREHKDL